MGSASQWAFELKPGLLFRATARCCLQVGLTVVHLSPALLLWRQVPLLSLAGACSVTLDLPFAAESMSRVPEWARSLYGCVC
jgi:hypothetical protein